MKLERKKKSKMINALDKYWEPNLLSSKQLLYITSLFDYSLHLSRI